MKLVELKDLSTQQLKAFAEMGELTPDEKAEVARLYMAQVSEADRQASEKWSDATPFEDFLRELSDVQQRWDEQKQ